MRCEWKKTTLGELYEFASGLSKGAKDFGFGLPFLSFKTVFNNYFVPDKIHDLANTTAQEQKKCSIQEGDVFLTRTSETINELGMSCVALRDYPFATFNGFTKRLRPKDKTKIYPKYAAFYFRSATFRSIVNGYTTLTTRASLNNETLQRLPMILPSFDEQKAIGDLLFSLHNKIDLNNKINANSEAQAQAIFKSWFIDFEPFQNGEFMDSDLGQIPKGWRIESLTKNIRFLNGLAMQKFSPNRNEKGLPVLKIKELRQGRCDNSSELCSENIKSEYIIDNGDVIFSWSGSLLVDIWCGGICGLNQHLFKVTSTEYDKWFYFLWTKYHLKEFAAIAAGKATTMGHIKRGDLDKSSIIVPDKLIYERASLLLSPIIQKMISVRVQNQTLAAIRDALLPRLMNGEIKVPISNEKAVESYN